MSTSSLIQLFSACIGIIGSLFFAVGIMRQSIEAMGRLSGSYWDSNPHIPPALASQKADYIFGGGFIVIAFVLQLASFLVPSDIQVLDAQQARYAPWVALLLTVCAFAVLRILAARIAKRFEKQIVVWLNEKKSQT